VSALGPLDAGDLLRRLFANLEQVLLVLVFIALPILRGIFEARKRKQAAGGRAPAAPRPSTADEAREAERTGRELWEELLRGEAREAPEPEPEPAPPPATAARPPPTPREAALPAEPQFEPVLADVFAPAYDEERLAEEVARERLAAAEEISLERAPPPPLVESAALEVESAALEVEGEEPGARRAAWLDLRRAVIASEVLGAPLALRPAGAGASLPPGLAW
jgi:hypothetical protein